MTSHRVKLPITAVARSKTGMSVTSIPIGAILNVPDTDRESGPIETVYEGQSVTVLLEDLRECSDLADQRWA